MSLARPTLPGNHRDPYGPHVPRPPKTLRIETIAVEPLHPSGYLPFGPDAAVPSRFKAHFVLHEPQVSVTIEVFVDQHLEPGAVSVNVRGTATVPVTTTALRRVLVDQLVRRAMQEAIVPAAVRTEWLATLPPAVQELAQQTETPAPLTAKERSRQQFDEDARRAAVLWRDAGAESDRTAAVARRMGRSTAQVARYFKRARELGIMPAARPRRRSVAEEPNSRPH